MKGIHNRQWLRYKLAAILAVLVVAFTGSTILFFGHAAVPAVSVEAEVGTLSGGAAATSDSRASGNQAITFAGGGLAPRSCQGRPDASCTGVPSGTVLSVINGDLTISNDGAVVEGRDISGFLIIQANNVTVKNTIIRGRTPSGNGAYINIKSGTGIIIQDTEIAPTVPSVYLDGIWGSNFTGVRLNIRGGVDGMKIDNNTRIESSYIHDLAYFASDPNQGGGSTHNDGIQILEGTGIRLVGNNIPMIRSNNAAVQVTQDYGVVSDLVASGNWFDGGGCTINIAHKTRASLSGVTFMNNRFGRNSSYSCPILLSTQSNVSLTNNVYDDNGQIVPVQVHD